MFKKLLLLSVLALLAIANDENECVEYYYWRDYNGEIPSDVLPGIVDENGDAIFIAQALHDDKLIPCQIYSNETGVAYCEFGMAEHRITENVKVLCTRNPEYFFWHTTNVTDMLTHDESTLVPGGYEATFSTWIGRTFTHGKGRVGKIMCRKTSCWGFYVTNQGMGLRHADSFDVLRCSMDLDVRNNL